MPTKTNIIVSGISIAFYVDDVNIGYTTDGVAVEHTKEYYDVECDQSVNILAKKIIKETCRIIVNMDETTLANLKIAMGEENSVSTGGGWSRLSFGGGVTEQEYLLRFEGKAPGTSKTRKLHIFTAISMEIGSASYKKGEKTMFPVTFEAIADTDKPEGEQYGYYEDQE